MKTKLMAFLATVDPQRAKPFYEEVLGLSLLSDDPFALSFDAGGILLQIVRVQKFDPQPFTVLGFEVEDIAARMAELAAKGVTFEIYEGFGQDEKGVMTFPDGDQVAWFKDPDGNLLSLSQLVAKN